jgi:hypothetical protein
VITFGSARGAMVYWLLITLFGVLLAGGALLGRRQRGKPIRGWPMVAAGVTVLGFAALGYTGVWRSFYSLERRDAGLALTYHWPSRQVIVPWDSVHAVDTGPGFKGNRPLRVIAGKEGRQHVSAMIPAREALRLSRCLSSEAARRRGAAADTSPSGECP